MPQSLKNILKIALGTFGSRILGLLRDILTTAFIGVNAVSSAFVLGFNIPNLFRRLMGEGALSTAFVPIFSQALKESGENRAFDFLNKIATRAMLALVFLVALGVGVSACVYFTPDIPTRYVLGAQFSALMMPYMILICLAALLCAALNVLGRFALPALTAVWLNVALISSIVLAGAALNLDAKNIALFMCGGVLLGGALQFFIPFFELRGLGWKYKFDLSPSREISEFTKLFLPALAGAAVIQINMFVSQLLAISIDNTAASAIYISSRLVELPLGLFTFSIVAVYFPKLASLSSAENSGAYASEFSNGLISLMFISIPAALGLASLNREILSLVFQWGNFDSGDVNICSPILAISALGIPFYSLATYSSRGFHSLKDTKTPVKISAAAFFINIGAALCLIASLGARALALANVISGAFQAAALGFLFWRKKSVESSLWEIAKILASSAAMLAFIFASKNILAAHFSGKTYALAAVCAVIPAAVCVYALALFALKFRGFNDIKNLLKRRAAK